MAEDLETTFQTAVEWVRSADLNLGNDQMLQFYAFFKQATVGPCTGDRPGFFDQKGRAKFDAWQGVGTEMSADDAKTAYVALAATHGFTAEAVAAAAEE